MANIYLTTNQTFYATISNSTIYGTTGTEDRIIISDDATGIVATSSIDYIVLTRNIQDYYFQQSGASLNIYNSTNDLIVTLGSALTQNLLTFSGDVTITLDGSNMVIDGVTLTDGAEPIQVITGTIVLSPNQTYYLNTSGTRVLGSTGAETLKIMSNTTDVSVNNNVEIVELPPGTSDSYKYKQNGTVLEIYYNSDSVITASIEIGSSGMQIRNPLIGAFDVKLTTSGMTIDGKNVSAVTPTTIELGTIITDTTMFLDINQTYTVTESGKIIKGAAGTETVIFKSDSVVGVTLDSSVDIIKLPGNFSNYKFSQLGATLRIYTSSDVFVTALASIYQTLYCNNVLVYRSMANGVITVGDTDLVDGASPVYITGPGTTPAVEVPTEAPPEEFITGDETGSIFDTIPFPQIPSPAAVKVDYTVPIAISSTLDSSSTIGTTDIKFADVTDGSMTGSGVFDKLMASMNKHIDDQYTKGRIKGTDYANVYLGALQAAATAANNFVLQEKLQEAQIDKLKADTKKVTNDTKLSITKLQNELATSAAQRTLLATEEQAKQYETSYILPAQLAEIQAKISSIATDAAVKKEQSTKDLLVKTEQITKLQEEVDLLQSQDLEVIAATIRKDNESVAAVEKSQADIDNVHANMALIAEKVLGESLKNGEIQISYPYNATGDVADDIVDTVTDPLLIPAGNRVIWDSISYSVTGAGVSSHALDSAIKASQASLYTRQEEGFDDNKKLKLFEAQLDVFGMAWSSVGGWGTADDDSNLPEAFQETEINALYKDLFPSSTIV